MTRSVEPGCLVASRGAGAQVLQYLSVGTLLGSVTWVSVIPQESSAETPPAGQSDPVADPPGALTATPLIEPREFVGTVEQRIEAGPYVYLRMVADSRRVWFVTLSAPDSGRIRALAVRRVRNFRSRLLDRSFDELWFGVALEAAPAPQPK